MKPEMPKSSDALVARFWELVPEDDRITRKRMFGYPCAVVGGNMLMSLHGERLVLRLPPDQIEQVVQRPGVSPFEPMLGRPMRGYVAVSADVLEDRDLIRGWVDSAFELGLSLPAKTPALRKSAPRRGTV